MIFFILVILTTPPHNNITYPFFKNGFPFFLHEWLEGQRNKHFNQKVRTGSIQSFLAHASSLNYRILLDTKDPINPSSRNKTYIHTSHSRRFSHFVATVDLKSNNAKTAVKSLLHHRVVKFGPPIYLVTDRGSVYFNTDMAQLCTLIGFLPHITPYSPWTNGLVEVQNLGTHLRMFLQNTPKGWAHQVHMYAYAHIAKRHSSLKVSLLEIVFHTRPRISLVFDLNLNRDSIRTCMLLC